MNNQQAHLMIRMHAAMQHASWADTMILQIATSVIYTRYANLARPLEEIPLEERYICCGSKKGIIYDKKAPAAVSKALGHQRLDVIADNYLYALPEHPCI